MNSQRIANLDLLRALAITMVLGFHIFQDLPYPIHWLTEYGIYGVHLFFALSGYLIGGLWFREHQANGHVKTLRFMAKRMIRTMPPYFVAFALYFAIRSQVSEDVFQWQFLFFLQNYLAHIPYYNISWSLCIEEHFYLVLPITLGLLWHWNTGRTTRAYILLGIALLPVLLRLNAYEGPVYFGYQTTATHLNYDFLAYGVLGAYLQRYFPNFVIHIQKRLPQLCIGTVLLLASFHWIPAKLQYCAGLPLLAVLLGALVTGMAIQPVTKLAKHPICYWIAITSYSVYLTHVLALNISEFITQRLGFPSILDVGLCILLSATGGLIFYYAVERPSIQLRRRLLRT